MYVFTIAVGTPKVTRMMLDTYLKHHNHPIHVYCSQDDREILKSFYKDSKIINYKVVSSQIERLFEQGHLGTSTLYADIILDDTIEDKLCHIDTDLIFRQEALSLILDKFEEGYSLIGPVRLYKNNPNNRSDCEYRPHVTQTYFFGFDKSKITKRPHHTIQRMAQGFAIDSQPVIDFFDPLAFDILQNKGRVVHVDYRLVGGFSEDSLKHNLHPFEREDLDWGSHVVHFGGGGTGERVYRGEGRSVSPSYASWACERYKMISNLFSLENVLFELDSSKLKLHDKVKGNL